MCRCPSFSSAVWLRLGCSSKLPATTLPTSCQPRPGHPCLPQVLARAGGRYSLVQVREAVDALQNEGHLYSTIDENHFKSCDV
jgi:hypothetical protein